MIRRVLAEDAAAIAAIYNHHVVNTIVTFEETPVVPNAGSVALHERMGFAKVAHFREVGWKFGRWIDVGYWQRTL